MSSCHSSSSPWETPRTSSLPPDLLRNILSRLPTASLPTLRSVCREWRNIIEDPHFAAVHATSGVKSPQILLLSGLSHGAECQFVMDDEFLVTSLPRSAARSCLYGARASRWRPHRIGTVRRLDGQHKIVRLSCPTDRAVLTVRAEVLDQGSWSWRVIASVLPSILVGGPVFAAGLIHWEAAGEGGLTRISSFDVTKEEFAWIPFPELRDSHLADLRGVLGLVDSSCQERVDVWAMEEGWQGAKQYSVRLNLPWPVNSHWSLTVLGWGGRKILFKCLESLLFYDPVTNELEYVQRAGDAGRAGSSITVSLLSPAKLWDADKVPPWVA
ncbi:hypothetical protein BT93_J0296 [Corymbia citriodora subsp. variegata]|nr:hypothetical protein BT93_J0296 [Corymbia citriodora subsp. variegata]